MLEVGSYRVGILGSRGGRDTASQGAFSLWTFVR